LANQCAQRNEQKPWNREGTNHGSSTVDGQMEPVQGEKRP
jgi:hypothetical protein